MGRQPVIGGLLLVANGPGDAACAGASQALAVTALTVSGKIVHDQGET